jgi:hypothetical protein
MQSTTSADQSVQTPGLISVEMKTIQAVLEVLSIYWKPLGKLVRLATALRLKASYPSSLCPYDCA